MQDLPSRPRRSPNQTRRPMVCKILHLRRTRGWGPARIANRLGLRASTVHKVLRREGEPLLHEQDLATRRALRKAVERYEHKHPGDLIHVDIKKLGKIPTAVAGASTAAGRPRRATARCAAAPWTRPPPAPAATATFTPLWTTTVAYSEVLADEQAVTAAAFWRRAVIWFLAQVVPVHRVLTDNDSCYRSRLWKAACTDMDITHKRTRPYRPQTNGKVEKFNRTLLLEWAYVRPYPSETARRRTLRHWLHVYNHHRTHTALGGRPPASRVTNLPGQNT